MRQQKYSYDSYEEHESTSECGPEKSKGNGKGRGKSPGVKTVNLTHGAAKPGPVPGSKNNQATPRRASPFHTPYAQGSSTSPPVQGSSTSSPVPQEAPEIPGIAAAPAACGPARDLSERFGTNAAQGSSISSPVPQAPEVPEIAVAPAACGPARELSGRCGTNADFIQRLTPQDKFAGIVMSRVNGRMKRKGHGSKHCVSRKLDGGSPWFYPDDPVEAVVPDRDTHLMRPIFLCVWECFNKDIKAPSCPRCRTPNNVCCIFHHVYRWYRCRSQSGFCLQMCSTSIVFKQQLNIRGSNHSLLKSQLVFAMFSSAVFYEVQVRMNHCKQ